jgi:hypothetical protein
MSRVWFYGIQVSWREHVPAGAATIRRHTIVLTALGDAVAVHVRQIRDRVAPRALDPPLSLHRRHRPVSLLCYLVIRGLPLLGGYAGIDQLPHSPTALAANRLKVPMRVRGSVSLATLAADCLVELPTMPSARRRTTLAPCLANSHLLAHYMPSPSPNCAAAPSPPPHLAEPCRGRAASH